MARCACPWCEKPAEEGHEALFSGKPTCKEHGYKALGDTIEKIAKDISNPSDSPS